MNGVIWQLDVLITYWRRNVHGCLCLYIVQSFPPYQKFSFHRYQCNDSPHTYTWLLEQVFVKEPVCDFLWLLNKRTAVVRNLLTYRMGDGKPNVMFVLGGPGAGKGTQCARFHCKECFFTWPPMKMSLACPPPPTTLLPAPVYICTFWSSFGRSQFTIVKCGEILRGSQAPENLSAFYNTKLAPAKTAPKSAHIHRGREQGALEAPRSSIISHSPGSWLVGDRQTFVR